MDEAFKDFSLAAQTFDTKSVESLRDILGYKILTIKTF